LAKLEAGLSNRWIIMKGDTAGYEILTIVAGVVIGLIVARLSSTLLKIAAIITGSVAVDCDRELYQW
jgi:biotin transporter BioY